MSDQPVTVRFFTYSDVDRILRHLYQGDRPQAVRFLICSCGLVADLSKKDTEAIGWQILPNPICPDCQKPYTGEARNRFLKDLQRHLALRNKLLEEN